MSNVREVLDLVELCEQQGFVTRRLARAGGWQIFPKDRSLQPICLYDARSNGSSQTRYLNQRSALKRIGVVFPELQKPTPKEATMQRPNVTTIQNVVAAPAQTTATPVKRTPADALARLKVAQESLQLAAMEMEEAASECTLVFEPLSAMSELLNKIRG